MRDQAALADLDFIDVILPQAEASYMKKEAPTTPKDGPRTVADTDAPEYIDTSVYEAYEKQETHKAKASRR